MQSLYSTHLRSSLGYLAGRPRYPDLLYDTVVNFHRGDRNTVLDIGTGPGLSLFPFAYTFRHLMGVDPSEGMVAQADDAWTAWKSVQESPSQLKTQDATFQVASAEELQPIADTSVDLITAATVRFSLCRRSMLTFSGCSLV